MAHVTAPHLQALSRVGAHPRAAVPHRRRAKSQKMRLVEVLRGIHVKARVLAIAALSIIGAEAQTRTVGVDARVNLAVVIRQRSLRIEYRQFG